MTTTDYPRYKQIGRTRFVERAPGLGWACVGVSEDAHATRNSADERPATQGGVGPIDIPSPELEEPGDGFRDAVDTVGAGDSAPETPRAVAVRQPDASAIYHADTVAIGQSMLKVFARDRREYYGMVTGQIEPEPETEALKLGTASHAVTLEKLVLIDGKLGGYQCPPPEVCASNGHRRGKAYEEWAESIGGKHFSLLPDQMAALIGMAASVRSKIGNLIDSDTTLIEQRIDWVHPLSALPCKAKPDLMYLIGDTAVIWDLKTYPGLKPFHRHAIDLQYDLQAVHYMEGVQAVHGVENVEFYLLAVSKRPPFTSAAYEFAESRLQQAMDRRTELLEELAECRRTGDWTNPREREITTIW